MRVDPFFARRSTRLFYPEVVPASRISLQQVLFSTSPTSIVRRKKALLYQPFIRFTTRSSRFASALSLSFTASQPLCKVQRPTPHLILLQATIVRRRGLRSCEKKKRLVNLLSNLNRSHGGQVVDRNARQRSGLPRGQPRDAKKSIFRFSRSNPHASPSSPRTSESPYNFILRSSQASAPLRCSPLLQEVHLLFFQD